MPFTPAHAAAALPLRRSQLILSAVITGTMAPDIEYFVRLKPGGGWGHTIPGAFGLSLPAGVVALWLFHRFAKVGIAALLPAGLQRRLGPALQPFQFLGLRRFLLIVVSLLAGIATHIAWDSLTHRHTWLYRHCQLLHAQVPMPLLQSLPLYEVLQWLSSLAGSAIVLFWIINWYRSTPPGPRPVGAAFSRTQKILILTAILALSAGAGLLRGYLSAGIPRERWTAGEFAADGVVAFGALLWWQLVAWGALMRMGVAHGSPQSELTIR